MNISMMLGWQVEDTRDQPATTMYRYVCQVATVADQGKSGMLWSVTFKHIKQACTAMHALQ